ncbi:hypothetical protein VKT23_018458 [Stygiomarasmius scandens]|uniref:Uncharacterized protein n=1 Tax=Marasmiellus scandens TaxID=2682957 RepID=A0ABR1INU0_9AGAR
MSGKNRNQDKKPPGRLAWYRKDEEIHKFLADHYPEFEKCFKAKTITSFYTSVTTKYFIRFVKEEVESGTVARDSDKTQSQTSPEGHSASKDLPSSNTHNHDAPSSDGDSGQPTGGDTEGAGAGAPHALSNDASTARSAGEDLPMTGENDSATGEVEARVQEAGGGQSGGSSALRLDDDGDKGLDSTSFKQAATSLGWVNLPMDKFVEKKQAFAEMRTKIGNYFRKEHRSIANGNILKKVWSETVKDRKKPQRLSNVQVFQSKYYQTLVKPTADKDWEAAVASYEEWQTSGDQSEGRKRPVRVAINYAAAKRVLLQQDEEFQAEMQRLADQGYEESRRKWEEAKGVEENPPEPVKTPDEQAQAIKKWGPAVSKITSALAADLNMAASTAFFGRVDGKIKVYWVHHGKTASGLLWPKFDPTGYTATETSLIRFGRAVFPNEIRSLGSNESSTMASSSSSPPEADHHDEIPTSRKPGPGRNSSGIRSKPGLRKTKPNASKSTATNAANTATATAAAENEVPSDEAHDLSGSGAVSSEVDLPQTHQSNVTNPLANDSPASATQGHSATSGDISAITDGKMEVDEPAWSHRKEKKFWPEMRKFIKTWGDEFAGWEREDWMDDLEGLMETFIEYEEAFRFTEDNGTLRSQKEFWLVKEWEKQGRPEWMDMEVPDEKVNAVLEKVHAWWLDILPERDSRDDNWSPLDSVSGKNGIWRFICCLVWIIVLLRGEENISERSDDQRRQIGEWVLLVREVEGTLGKVIQYGIWPPKKRKSMVADQPENAKRRRTTRAMAVQVDKVADKKIARKGKGRKGQ